MKKVLLVFSLILLFMTGCGTDMGTPTAKVEEFLGKYQKMDSEVLTQLDSVISTDEKMSDSQKNEYRGLMEKQYQNLSYKIKNEEMLKDELSQWLKFIENPENKEVEKFMNERMKIYRVKI